MLYNNKINNNIREKLFKNYFIEEDKTSIAIMSNE